MMPNGQPPFDIPSIEQLGQSSTRASQALSKHHDALMARKGVTMIGESVDARGQPAIVIGVRNAKDMVGLPHVIDGVPVIIQVTGTVKAQSSPPWTVSPVQTLR
jgi:hypothetical protein